MDGQRLRELLDELNEKLAEHDEVSEMYVLGGAAMILEYESKRSTTDVDCVFTYGTEGIHRAVAEIAEEHPGLEHD